MRASHPKSVWLILVLFFVSLLPYSSAQAQLPGYQLQFLKDISIGTVGAEILNLTLVGDQIFFSANDDVHGNELWLSDGTAAGTKLVKDIVPGAEGSYPHYLTAALDKLFFSIEDENNEFHLWVSDGTEAGTIQLADLEIEFGAGIVFDNRWFFQADDGINGFELWVSDGTVAGTQLLKDIYSGSSSSYP
jgi:ELWxxDGT repeat protein